MPLTPAQETDLLKQKWVGKTIIARLTAMGLDDVDKLAAADMDDVLEQGAAISGSTCWKNSPQAKQAITNAINWAKNALSDEQSQKE